MRTATEMAIARTRYYAKSLGGHLSKPDHSDNYAFYIERCSLEETEKEGMLVDFSGTFWEVSAFIDGYKWGKDIEPFRYDSM